MFTYERSKSRKMKESPHPLSQVTQSNSHWKFFLDIPGFQLACPLSGRSTLRSTNERPELLHPYSLTITWVWWLYDMEVMSFGCTLIGQSFNLTIQMSGQANCKSHDYQITLPWCNLVSSLVQQHQRVPVCRGKRWWYGRKRASDYLFMYRFKFKFVSPNFTLCYYFVLPFPPLCLSFPLSLFPPFLLSLSLNLSLLFFFPSN